MSGPKVVRIVTREEIEAICRGHLRDVDQAIAAFSKIAQRHDALNAQVEADLERRRAQLRAMMDGERWMDVQKHGPAVVEFLRAEGAGIRAAAVEAGATARAKGRRLSEAARSIVSALEAKRQVVDPKLREVDVRAGGADEAALRDMEGVLNEALQQLGPHQAAPGLSEEQRQLASRLGKGASGTTLAQWAAANAQPNPRDERLDRLISEVEVVGNSPAAEAFARRAATITAESSGERRALLTDSLTLEVAQFVRERARAELAASRLEKAAAELRDIGTGAARAMEGKISHALSAGHADADALVSEAQGLIDAHAGEAAAVARRRAVLQGLSALGYEVREQMASAWARDGRVVVRKPGQQDYGLELGAPADAARLQVRLVGAERPSMPRNEQRDTDQEVTWCSEFERLGTLLRASGVELTTERAVGAGVQAVKTVAFEGALPNVNAERTNGPLARDIR